MKISLNDEEIFTLSDTQKKVILNEIPEEIFESDMIRRLNWSIHHPAIRFAKQHAKHGRAFLKDQGIESCPSDLMEMSEKVFDYSKVEMFPDELGKHIVKVDGKECFEVSLTTKKLLKMEAAKNCHCYDWMKEKLKWIITHKYEYCMENLRREWEPRLINEGVKEFPVDDDAFAELVFKHPEYKNRSVRDSQSSG